MPMPQVKGGSERNEVKKLTVDELTRRAFIWAEQDRAAMVNCWPPVSPERQEAKDECDQLHKYRVKRWGRTKLEAAMDGAVSKDVREMKGTK